MAWSSTLFFKYWSFRHYGYSQKLSYCHCQPPKSLLCLIWKSHTLLITTSVCNVFCLSNSFCHVPAFWHRPPSRNCGHAALLFSPTAALFFLFLLLLRSLFFSSSAAPHLFLSPPPPFSLFLSFSLSLSPFCSFIFLSFTSFFVLFFHVSFVP